MSKFLDKESRQDRIFNNDKSKNKKPIQDQENKKKVDSSIAKIEKTILDTVGEPPHFWKMEIKPVGNKCYRANMVCSKLEKTSMFPNVYRPHSYYVIANNNNDLLTFKPELTKLY
jgi:hypothetical protein